MGAGGANTGQARRPNRLHLGGSIIRCQLVLVHRCTKRLAHGRVRAGTGNTIGRVAWTRAKMESRRPLSDDRRRAALEPRVYEPWIASRLSRWKWHVLFHGDNRLDRLRRAGRRITAGAAAAVCIALGPAHPRPVLFVGLAVALVLFIGIVGLAAMNRLELAFRLTLVSGGIVVVTLLAAGVSL
jgi:hypothetical protein